jgi:hypothetical protein
MSVELAQPPDAAPAAVEVGRLRRYLEVSQATLKVAKREMQAVRDQ